MQEALRKATTEDFKHVSDVLLPMLPDLLTAVRGVVIDPESTPSQRMRCLEILMCAWSRVVRNDTRQLTATASQQKSAAKIAAATAITARASRRQAGVD